MNDFDRVCLYYLHGHYGIPELEAFVRAGVITAEEKDAIVAAAAE